jgi:tRNA 2-thiouridine synthesizing protein B
MLHTVNKSPFERNTLKSCLAHLRPGDAILLFEDGVVGARAGSSLSDQVSASMNNCDVYALGPDLAARGIAETDLIDGIKVVDYRGFVDLVAGHPTNQAWL